ncbi:hypothetical protein F183_A53870 [Bryobacterales bacterium F-183]|nr:hypothetical protein F183_A53870 [Bryobacterales bacterium F-183]
MSNSFSLLETNILKAKGLADAQIAALVEAGVNSREAFQTVGSAATLLELMPGLDAGVAQKVMEWAVGASTASAPQVGGPNIVLDTSDVVYCVHCGAKQPKDYKSGDLCSSCGRQAEPILSCHWCSASGPGKFCRSCGAEFVAPAEYDLALLLKREGLPKDEIATRLKNMAAVEKDQLWGRIRRSR